MSFVFFAQFHGGGLTGKINTDSPNLGKCERALAAGRDPAF